jgi:hypothetical protein
MWLDTIRFADSIEVLSLHPDEQPEASDTFYGFPVLGRARVADNDTRARLIADLVEGLLETVSAADCFFPRHGVRAVCQGRVVELVICFECNQARVYPEGWTTISDRPRAIIVQMLQAARIPLSPV